MGSQRVGHDWVTELNWCRYTAHLEKRGEFSRLFQGFSAVNVHAGWLISLDDVSILRDILGKFWCKWLKQSLLVIWTQVNCIWGNNLVNDEEQSLLLHQNLASELGGACSLAVWSCPSCLISLTPQPQFTVPSKENLIALKLYYFTVRIKWTQQKKPSAWSQSHMLAVVIKKVWFIVNMYYRYSS